MVSKQVELEDFLKAKLDALGHELVSSKPMAPPVGFKKAPSMVEHLRSMVRSELLAREVAAQGLETFEEADDFDIADDPVDPSTPYERHFDDVPVSELREREKASRAPPVGGAAPVPAPPAAPAAPEVVTPPVAASGAPSKG